MNCSGESSCGCVLGQEAVWQHERAKGQRMWVLDPALPLTNCVYLGLPRAVGVEGNEE